MITMATISTTITITNAATTSPKAIAVGMCVVCVCVCGMCVWVGSIINASRAICLSKLSEIINTELSYGS